MKFKVLFILSVAIWLTGQIPVWGQSAKVTLSGTVSDAKNGETMPAVVVNIKELNLWVTSDIDGNFHFKNVTPGTYTLTASCLGYEDYSIKIALSKAVENYKLKLNAQSLALEEVVVTAKEGGKLNSSSTINKTAIDHLQGASLTDVMQLLPGSVTTNPDLTKINKISIRDISGDDATNALGTAVIVDGARLSNDANLQSRNDISSFETTKGTGVDARQVSVDNVESVEIIRGVASAEYGDMTSGAVVVKTKAGKTPFQVRFKTDPNIKQVSAGKGLSLGENKGFFNVDAEYARAFKDVRTPSKSFDRVTAQFGYSNIFNPEKRAVSFNAKLKGIFIKDKYERDPDQVKDEVYKAQEQQVSLNLYGNWMIQKPWLTNINYNLFGSYGNQYNREKIWRTPGRVPSTSETITGEQEGILLPYEYFSDLKIKGKPIYVTAKVTANVAGKYGSVYNKFLLGAEWSTKGNKGEGKTFDANRTPSQNLRPRSFKDIPFIQEYTGFIEDKVTFTMNKKSLELSAGLRFTTIETRDYDYDVVFDPRFNARFVFLDNKWNRKGFQHLSIRAGWGILHKMPGLAYLYPDPSYVDRSSFSYNDEENNYSLGVMTTMVTETANRDLELPKSTNFEFGVDLKFWGITANLAYFNEKLRKGFSFAGAARPFFYREYNLVNESGKRPQFVNGMVEVDGKPVDYSIRETFATYNRAANGVSNDKWGIEYSLDFGKIKAISTSVIVDGAYFYNKQLENNLQMQYETSNFGGGIKDYPFVGIYAGGNTNSGSNGTKSQRLNTNVRLVTHLPKLRLIFTLTGQCVWIDKTQRLAEYQGKSLLYYRDQDKNMVDGSNPDAIAAICVNPIAYMDLEGRIHPFTEAERLSPDFDRYIRTSRPEYFTTDSQDPYFMLNIRLTKEIGRIASLSFYANNFTNSRPRRFFRSGAYYQRLNTEMSFGAELQLKF